MDKRILVSAMALILLGAGCANGAPTTETTGASDDGIEVVAVETGEQGIAVGEPNPSTPEENEEVTDEPKDESAEVDGEVKSFTVTGDNFTFSPSTMTVKKGDTVRITFKNAEGFHDLKIDEFSVATKQMNAGGEETVEFVAEKAGSFEYYCSVGKHRDMGMKGTLVVTE